MRKSGAIKALAITGLFTALVTVVTAYFPRVPTPGFGGYVHMGDAVVYLAAALLPKRNAAAAAALGGALADLLTGYAPWAPFTAVIKAALVLPFSSGRQSKMCSRRNAAATVIAFPITMGGYYLAQALLTDSLLAPLAALPYNAFQAGVSAAIFLCFARAMDKVGLKERVR
ncbi:MAG: TIGR04002 family protein [Synergistaceae bacterium]|jgi:uncharacterized repeat protein (TIGR04002 family)|nr:TIGR04002 family protein [Synergistaceae bacterium]